MNPNKLSWMIENMIITIKYDGSPVMKISAHEVIESSSRKSVLAHVKECDNTPWLTRWQAEKHQEIVDILKR